MKKWLFSLLVAVGLTATAADERPNILVCVSDDQSYPHASAYGYEAVRTPSFDRIAAEGVLFTNAFTPAPGCSPMRASFLTGKYIWEIGPAGTHASSFPKEYPVYPEVLEKSGYQIGATGKLWGPGRWEVSGRDRNPAGPAWNDKKMEAPSGVRNTDYAGNFEAFLESRDSERPFCFWFGASEPHRAFGSGNGERSGLRPEDVEVPGFLPDTETVRGDLLDYAFEVEWFDTHVGRCVAALEARGELDNTVVVVTSDNGMAFPRAKANVYEYGIHMPLAIRWGDRVPGGRVVHDLVNLIDVTATLYEVSRTATPTEFPLSGRSLIPILYSEQSGWIETSRLYTFSGRERHSSSRYHSLGYPQRAIRDQRYLFIWNLKPERWPAGTPRKIGVGSYPKPEELSLWTLGPSDGGYHDIDACPTLQEMIQRKGEPRIGKLLELATGMRPEYELYDIVRDPACLNNLVNQGSYSSTAERLRGALESTLRATGDPRLNGGGDVFESYPRFSPVRVFPEPEWAKEHPEWVPDQPWLRARLGPAYR